MANNRNGRTLEIPESQDFMEKMKMEVATELGIPNYDKIDKGMLPAKVHGFVGGNMVRKMIKEYQKAASNGGTLQANTGTDVVDNSIQEDKQEVQNAISQVNQLLGTDVTQEENVTH